ASDTVSAPGYSWGGDTNTGLFHSAADTLNFTTAGTERMEISSTGLVGINTAPTTGYTLHVETSSATSTYGAIRGESTSASYGVYGISVSGNALQGISSTGRGVRGEATSTTAVTNYGGSFLASGTTGIGVFGEASAGSYGGYFQNTSGPAAGFNRQTDDGVVVNIRQAGTTEGTITVSGTTVSYTAFTGSHYAWPSQEIDRGYLVSFNNDNKYLNGNEKSEVIYGVDITTKANSKDVLGSYLSIQTPKEELSVENPALVMAVGNGDMWVADNGSNLEVGDYLISSDVPGHAMKVTDEYPVAYVVARVAENVDWSKVEEKTEDGIKHKKISVLFESFILNQDLGLAFDKNQNLDDLSWFYAMEAKTPVEKAIQTQKQQLDALETKVERMESEGCANTDAELMEYIKQLEARVEALEAEKAEPVKTSFWSKLW
ncbi:MAG TPA: hypothetical protein PL066_00875, partial [bacterium]|nr:hypothetical protein [bacterium]